MAKNKDLELIEKIPDISKYENKKVEKKNSWFNRNISFLIAILFILLGIIIVLAIAK